MHIRKILAALLAVAVAYAFAPTQGVQASSLLGPGSQIATDNMTQLVQDKAPAKKAKAKASGKRSASKGPGRCGTGNYWDRKKRACASKG